MTLNRSYTRHLPHQAPAGFPLLITWNLKGAMPANIIEELKRKRGRLERQAARPGETSAERSIRENKIIFAAADRYVDETVDGPMHLKDPAAAKIVEDSILFGAGERYDLFAWCVMSNHVHVLLTPSLREVERDELRSGPSRKPGVRIWDLLSVTSGIKGYTAYRINELQDTRGQAFWQDESYDHWARDEDEMMRIIRYIEDNPVKARLCRRAENWPWSSARFRANWRPGEAFRMKERCRP